ncbi:hypothetical protein HZA55_05830 [Candidatus Poribacteria bacterium]|nr:hypothetical protein [Candidatus Poribacteria bacterium]
MIVKRQDNEIVIRIQERIDINVLQNFIDYLKTKSIISKSKASKENIENISKEINNSWWNKNKNRFIK